MVGALLNFNAFVTELRQISSDSEFDSLAARVSLKAIASIALGLVGSAFYGYTATLGFLNSMLPFNILNFAIFFFATLLKN